jgi:tetratricopeptide (TPR) repeat protein
MARASTQRRRRPRPQAPRSKPRSSSPEDLMFFPRLRRRAKWVFLFLALAFGLGFVAFGVGTGVSGTSLGDVLQDFLNRQPEGIQSVEDAREEAQERPNDVQAQITYATALQANGRRREAIVVLERYTTRKPRDVQALRQLALMWGAEAGLAREAAQVAGAEAQQISLQATLAPTEGGGFFQEVAGNRISETLAQEAQAKASEAQGRASRAARQEATAWRELSLLTPEDSGVFLQLGIASQGAGDIDAAIAAYEKFLELAPDDSRAEVVQEQIDLLKESQEEQSG